MLPIALSIVIALGAPVPDAGPPPSARVEMDAALEHLSAGEPQRALAALGRADAALDGAERSPQTQQLRATVAMNQGIAAIELHRAGGSIEPLERAHARLQAVDRQTLADADARESLDGVAHAVERELSRSESTPSEKSGETKKLPRTTIAGIAVMSSAAIGLGFMVTGLVQGALAERDYERGPTRNDRIQADQSGAKANTMAFVGGLAAGILLGAGAALLVLGQRVDQRGHETSRRRIRLAPMGVRF